MTLNPSVDLSLLASQCGEGEGRGGGAYTGADLQALLYNAQLEAVHEVLERGEEGGGEGEEVEGGGEGRDRAVVKVEHVKKAFDTTRPSLSAKELQRFEAIYESFLSGRGKGGKKGKGEGKGKGKEGQELLWKTKEKRVTLA